MSPPTGPRPAPTLEELQDMIHDLGADLRKQISAVDRRAVRIETRVVRALTAMGCNPDGHPQTEKGKPQ